MIACRVSFTFTGLPSLLPEMSISNHSWSSATSREEQELWIEHGTTMRWYGWPESNYKSGSINWYFWSSECTTFRVTFAHLFRIQANKQCKGDFLQIFRVIDCTNLVYVTAIRFCKISISIATTQWQIQICWQRQVLWSDSTWSYWNRWSQAIHVLNLYYLKLIY